MEILDILQAISNFLGLDFGSLLASAAGVTIVINFLKATPPFSEFIKGNVIILATSVLSLIISASILWGQWLQILEATVLIAVLSVAGWATAKMLMHKVGTKPTNSSGGGK